MTNETAARKKLSSWDTPGGNISISPNMVRQLFNAPTATDLEIFTFVKICQRHQLNPFLKEIFLIKYDPNSAASFVMGKETYTQRAERNPRYDGHEAGVVVMRDGELVELQGGVYLPTDKLYGGWAKVYRKDRDRPLYKSVMFGEYDTGRSLWKSKRATMIEKVALVQALREAFPGDFVGLFDSAEMGVDLPGPDVEGTIRNVEEGEPVAIDFPDEPEQAPVAEPEPWTDQDFSDMFAWMQERGLDLGDLADDMGIDEARPDTMREFARDNSIDTWQNLMHWWQVHMAGDASAVQPGLEVTVQVPAEEQT